MASQDETDTTKPSSGTTRKRPAKAPPQTIDLKADEVKDASPEADAKASSGTKSENAPKANETKAEAVSPEPARLPPLPPSVSAASTALAAVIGAVIGAGIFYALLQSGTIPDRAGARAASEIAELKQTVATLSAAVEADDGAAAVDLSGIETGLAALQGEVETLRATAANLDASGTDALAELVARVGELEATAAATVTKGGEVSEALAERLNALDEKSAEAATALADLQDRIAGLAWAGGDASPVDLTPLETRIGALEEASAGVAGQMADAIAAIPAPDLSALKAIGDQVSGLQERIATVEQSVSSLSAAIDTMSENVDTLAARETGMTDERRAAYLVALAGLQRASSGSGPFATELNAVRTLADDPELFVDLNAYAQAGVPSMSDLSREFTGLAAGILDATARANANSVMARLRAGAQTLVRIRPTGYVAGDTPASRVARIEALLVDRKLATALEEWQALPEAGQAASADWAAKARDRHTLDTALAGLTAGSEG